jgi:hypothetical protein
MPLTKIQSLGITDGTIVNADINASAAIAGTKISGSFGKVLQVITGTDSTARTTTSSSFVTGSNTLSVSITPSSVSSKIFVIVTTSAGQDTASRSAFFTIRRDATNISFTQCNDTSDKLYYPLCMSVLDSPATTSAITYQLYFATDGVGTNTVNYASTKGSLTAFEIGA